MGGGACSRRRPSSQYFFLPDLFYLAAVGLYVVRKRLRVGEDGVEGLAVRRQELLADGALEHGLHRVVIAVCVQNGHGLGVAAELLERQGLEELLEGAYPAGQDTNTLPLIFCGTLPLVLAALFFLRPGPLRPKLAAGGLLACLLLSFWLRTPDLVWHGFQSPSWFNYRYSFLFIFTLLELAALGGKGFAKRLPAARQFASAGAVALLLACAWSLGLVPDWAAALTLCCLAAAALLLAMPRRRAAGLLAAFCLAAELTANGWSSLEAFEPSSSTLPQLTKQWQSTVEELSAQAPSARMQLTEGGQNTPFLLGYNGLSHYSSSYSQTTYELLRALGCTGTSGWMAWSDGLTQSAASLLGLRWQLGGTASGQWQQQDDVWENPCALPLVVAAADIESERLGAGPALRQPEPDLQHPSGRGRRHSSTHRGRALCSEHGSRGRRAALHRNRRKCRFALFPHRPCLRRAVRQLPGV